MFLKYLLRIATGCLVGNSTDVVTTVPTPRPVVEVFRGSFTTLKFTPVSSIVLFSNGEELSEYLVNNKSLLVVTEDKNKEIKVFYWTVE